MVWFRPHSRGRERLRALRELYRSFIGETTPEARALRLLREWLSADQRAQFEQYHYFDVTGCDSGKKYRIHFGYAVNVHELDRTGKPKLGLCFVPSAPLAAGDVMLAQKIALETDETAALTIANRFAPTFPREFAQRRSF